MGTTDQAVDQAPGQPGAASWDVRRAHSGVYRQRAGGTALLDVPPLSVLAVEGHGDPNTAPAHREAVAARYTLGYAVRAAAKRELGRVHTVGPLEALWSAADLDAFLTRDTRRGLPLRHAPGGPGAAADAAAPARPGGRSRWRPDTGSRA